MFTTRYPRGERELIAPFHRFSAEDTVAWFEARGVRLKREEDGRMFPITDSSETIIDCLINEAKSAGVRLFTRKVYRERACPKRRRVRIEIRAMANRRLAIDYSSRRVAAEVLAAFGLRSLAWSHDRTASAFALFAPCFSAVAAIVARNFGRRRGSVRGKPARARTVADHTQRSQRAGRFAPFGVGREDLA